MLIIKKMTKTVTSMKENFWFKIHNWSLWIRYWLSIGKLNCKNYHYLCENIYLFIVFLLCFQICYFFFFFYQCSLKFLTSSDENKLFDIFLSFASIWIFVYFNILISFFSSCNYHSLLYCFTLSFFPISSILLYFFNLISNFYII